jgi:hypothetical protein
MHAEVARGYDDPQVGRFATGEKKLGLRQARP